MTRNLTRLLALAIAVLLCVVSYFVPRGSAGAQAVQPPSTYQPILITFNGVPSLTCTPDQVALNVSTGDFYSCNPATHTWRITGTSLLSANNTITGSNTFTQQIISSVSTGTAPFSIASTTQVANLNAALHGGLSAPGSAIVGISDTQSLTNKTLTGASTGNTISILNAQANAGAITGNNSAQTVYTYTLPASTVASLKGIRVTVGWLHTGSANVTYALNLNGQTSANPVTGVAGTGEQMVATFLNTGATTGSFSYNFVGSNSGGVAGAGTLSGLSWGSSQVLTLTFNVANTDSVTPLQWIVEQVQ